MTIDDGLTLADTVTLINASTVTQNGDTLVLGQSPSDSAIVRNAVGASWILAAKAGIGGAGSSAFVNLGLLEARAGPCVVDANFYDRGGTIQVDQAGGKGVLGQLTFASPGDVNRFVDDKIAGPGGFALDGGVLIGSSISTGSTDLTVARAVGNVTISSAVVQIDDLSLAAGSVVTFTNPVGELELGARIGGVGEIYVNGPRTVRIDGTGDDDASLLAGGVTFSNSGQTDFYGYDVANPIDSAGFSLNTRPLNGATVTIENQAGATWTDLGNSSVYQQLGQGGNSLFVNDGTFVANSSYNNEAFDIPLQNNGLVIAGFDELIGLGFDDTFAINAALSGSGAIYLGFVDARVADAVGAGQTLDFVTSGTASSHPSLEIDRPDLFATTISGFGLDDQLEVNPAWSFVDYVPSNGGTDGALLFSDGASQASIHLNGSYDPAGFSVAATNFTVVTYRA